MFRSVEQFNIRTNQEHIKEFIPIHDSEKIRISNQHFETL